MINYNQYQPKDNSNFSEFFDYNIQHSNGKQTKQNLTDEEYAKLLSKAPLLNKKLVEKNKMKDLVKTFKDISSSSSGNISLDNYPKPITLEIIINSFTTKKPKRTKIFTRSDLHTIIFKLMAPIHYKLDNKDDFSIEDYHYNSTNNNNNNNINHTDTFKFQEALVNSHISKSNIKYISTYNIVKSFETIASLNFLRLYIPFDMGKCFILFQGYIKEKYNVCFCFTINKKDYITIITEYKKNSITPIYDTIKTTSNLYTQNYDKIDQEVNIINSENCIICYPDDFESSVSNDIWPCSVINSNLSYINYSFIKNPIKDDSNI